MTVSAQNNENVFDGDGATTLFTYTFTLPAGSVGDDIYVYVIDDEGTITLLTGNYTLDINAGTVTYPNVSGQAPLDPGVTALPAGWQLAIYRIEDIVQALSLTTQGPFPAAGLMAAMDYLTLICQQLQEQINRCVKYPIGQLPTTTDVNDFLAAVNAIIATPPIQGTYAYCKAIAALAPTTWRFAIVNDQNDQGTNQLFFYSGNVAAGDGGWLGPLTGGA